MNRPARRPSPIEAGELPHFIFQRARPAEKAYGFTLAGVLLTDIPSDRELSERDRQLIFDIIQTLNDAAAGDPDWNEAGLWRRGAMPPGGVEAPFSHAIIRARAKGAGPWSCGTTASAGSTTASWRKSWDGTSRPRGRTEGEDNGG
jgi:hypothetical protein